MDKHLNREAASTEFLHLVADRCLHTKLQNIYKFTQNLMDLSGNTLFRFRTQTYILNANFIWRISQKKVVWQK